MPRDREPVTIRGVDYRSHSEAAEALGVVPSVVSEADKYGWLDSVGLEVPKFLPDGAYNPSWLSRFLARNSDMTDSQLARELKMPLHRIHYMLSRDGWDRLMKGKK